MCALLEPASGEPLRSLRYLDAWLRGPEETCPWTSNDAASLVSRARSRPRSRPRAACGLRLAAKSAAASGPGPLPHDLPAVCHPSLVTRADEARFACVRDVWMAQTAWCVRCAGDWWLDEGMWLEDESGEYDPDEH